MRFDTEKEQQKKIPTQLNTNPHPQSKRKKNTQKGRKSEHAQSQVIAQSNNLCTNKQKWGAIKIPSSCIHFHNPVIECSPKAIR